MTVREQAERAAKRKERVTLLMISFRFYFACLCGVVFVLILPGIKNGIRGIEVYVPNFTEAGVALAVAYAALTLDEELGGAKVYSKKVIARKTRHAFLLGVSAIAVISKLLGA